MSTTDGTPGQSAAARAHVTQLRQDGGTCRSIAAAALVHPNGRNEQATMQTPIASGRNSFFLISSPS